MTAHAGTVVYKPGADIEVGDVIDYGAEGFCIVRFGPYDSPLIPITGPGRLAYNYKGEGMSIYDKHPMRVRLVAE